MLRVVASVIRSFFKLFFGFTALLISLTVLFVVVTHFGNYSLESKLKRIVEDDQVKSVTLNYIFNVTNQEFVCFLPGSKVSIFSIDEGFNFLAPKEAGLSRSDLPTYRNFLSDFFYDYEDDYIVRLSRKNKFQFMYRFPPSGRVRLVSDFEYGCYSPLQKTNIDFRKFDLGSHYILSLGSK